MQIPILEFDPNRQAILEPNLEGEIPDFPEAGVLCFFADVINNLIKDGRLKRIGQLKSEMGVNPLYQIEQGGKSILVVHPGVGAPLAAGFFEEIISLGARKFIACGGCGVLNHAIAAGHPVVLTSAVRDEGTSYHYLPPDREVTASPRAVAALEAVLQEKKVEYLIGKSWTTDAIYRETEQRRALRMAEGCQVVEMEAAAFFAVAQFRGVVFGQLVYGGDLVVPEGWDGRGWHRRDSDRALMFELALEACARL